MPSPRHEVYDPNVSQWFHCYSRCVRRAFLCGHDAITDRDFEHRREWIRARLAFLAEMFAIEVATHGIMDNHLHTVLCTRPDVAEGWSVEEVARRWLTLFPRQGASVEQQIEILSTQPERIELYRQRLASLSWFHRCLNEPIARRANREDDCTGRFWEGRFRSEVLTSTEAVIACAVYVDLNPIRAGKAKTPEQSTYTGVQQRILEKKSPAFAPSPRVPLMSIADLSQGTLTEEQYLTLVDQTGRTLRDGKAAIPAEIAPILERLSLNPDKWLTLMTHKKHVVKRALGPADTLRALAKRFGRQWFHGISAANALFVQARMQPTSTGG